MLAPVTTSSVVWPIAGDAPDLQAIVWAQAKTITNNEVLLHAYQLVLNNAQLVTATGNGTNNPAASTTLLMTSVVGIITLGSTITGTGVPANTTVVAQTAGTPGGNGTYTISGAASISAALLTFTPGGGNPPWPVATDPQDLMQISLDQTAVLRMQSALLQQYHQLLNDSATTPPATGP
jgi:hypothetical protein